MAGKVVFMSKAQNASLHCVSFFGIATDGSSAHPGSGNLTLYGFEQNPTSIGIAMYTAVSLTVAKGECKWNYGLANIEKYVDGSSGLLKISPTKIVGSDECYACSHVYWHLWSAVGEIAWVPLSTRLSEPCYVALFRVTPGSTLEKGNFSIFKVISSSNEMISVGPEYGYGSYTASQLTLTAIEPKCSLDFKEASGNCDESKCRSPGYPGYVAFTGFTGFDCVANGQSEPYSCADGYTNKTLPEQDNYAGEYKKYTCCKPEAAVAGNEFMESSVLSCIEANHSARSLVFMLAESYPYLITHLSSAPQSTQVCSHPS
jgi:hypothetical protein